MSNLDDRIRRGLEGLAHPGDPRDAFARVARRKRRRRIVRRTQTAALTVAILAGTAGGMFALSRAFDLGGGTGPAEEPVVGPTVTPSPSPETLETASPAPTRACPEIVEVIAEEVEDLPSSYRPVGKGIGADVTGDGRADFARIYGDEERPPRCRYFLTVSHPAGVILVAPIATFSWFPRAPSLLMAVEIDGEPGLEVVVDFGGPRHPHRNGRIFTYEEGSLVQMRTERPEAGPGTPLLGDPLLAGRRGFPDGVDCADEPGTIVVTMGRWAEGGKDQAHYDFTRTFYRARGALFVEIREEAYTVDVGTESERWPELADDPFRSCRDRVD